jgi:predicted amidohydrolase
MLVRRQIEAGAELVLVPSCTDTLAGYHRVALSCRARALENQCFVVQSPTVGEAPWSKSVDVNRGAAGVYGPVDRGFPDDGVIAQGQLDVPGWVFADLDLAHLSRVREEGQVKNHRDFGSSRHLQGEVTRTRL